MGQSQVMGQSDVVKDDPCEHRNANGLARASSQVLYNTVKSSTYIAQYQVLRTVQSALHFTSLTDLFIQTPSRLLWEASSHMLQLMRKGCSYTYPPLSTARYSFIELSEQEQCRVKTLVQSVNTAAPDSNSGSRSREYEVLPLSHCALQSHVGMLNALLSVSLTI